MSNVPAAIGLESFGWGAIAAEAASRLFEVGKGVVSFLSEEGKKEVNISTNMGVLAIVAVVSLIFSAITFFTMRQNTHLHAVVEERGEYLQNATAVVRKMRCYNMPTLEAMNMLDSGRGLGSNSVQNLCDERFNM